MTLHVSRGVISELEVFFLICAGGDDPSQTPTQAKGYTISSSVSLEIALPSPTGSRSSIKSRMRDSPSHHGRPRCCHSIAISPNEVSAIMGLDL